VTYRRYRRSRTGLSISNFRLFDIDYKTSDIGLFHFKKDHVAYSIAAEHHEALPLFVPIKENRLLNEFFLYVLEDLHTTQGLGALKFTWADPAFVKETVERVFPLIPETPTAPQMPATRAFSRQLVAYIAAFLPTALYFRSNGSRISAVCDDQYSSTLASAMLEETVDEAFKFYMTRKTQGRFRRWGCPRPSDAAASSGPCAAPDGAGSGTGAATPARPPGPAASDDEGASDLITADGDDQTTSPYVTMETLPSEGRA
jgi:hypothetical protein